MKKKNSITPYIITAISLLITTFSVALAHDWIKTIDRIVTAEEYLMPPNYYKVDTTQVNGVQIYSVREK